MVNLFVMIHSNIPVTGKCFFWFCQLPRLYRGQVVLQKNIDIDIMQMQFDIEYRLCLRKCTFL